MFCYGNFVRGGLMSILSHLCLNGPCQQQLSKKVHPREKPLQLDVFLSVTAFSYHTPPPQGYGKWLNTHEQNLQTLQEFLALSQLFSAD